MKVNWRCLRYQNAEDQRHDDETDSEQRKQHLPPKYPRRMSPKHYQADGHQQIQQHGSPNVVCGRALDLLHGSDVDHVSAASARCLSRLCAQVCQATPRAEKWAIRCSSHCRVTYGVKMKMSQSRRTSQITAFGFCDWISRRASLLLPAWTVWVYRLSAIVNVTAYVCMATASVGDHKQSKRTQRTKCVQSTY